MSEELISIDLQQRLSLTQLAQQTGVNASTCWRWAQRGVRGIRLQTFIVGGRRFTSKRLFDEFVAATTAAVHRKAVQHRTNRQRESSVRLAEEELAKAGI